VVSDTAPIRPEEQFDAARVDEWLRGRLPNLIGDAPIAFEQFPGGKANLTYLARAGEVELVLRRPPLGPVAPGSHDMRREYAVLSVLHRVFPAAPRALALCEDETVMGKVFLVMERRRGHVIRETWPAGLRDDDPLKRRVAEAAADTLAALHRVDYEALGLGDLGRPSGFLERQVAGWIDRWHRAADDEVAAMEEAARRFGRAVPVPQAAVLLHNDYKLDNLMVGEEGSVVAVLDWDMATLGDPLVDLGTALAYWAEPGDAIHDLPGVSGVTVSGQLGREELVERYAAATGFDVAGVDYYHGFARFRIAVIIQQIYIRFVRGQTSDPRFAALAPLVPMLAEEALALAPP
jgi:aminoglycoside phosphotransferase (APT) family kinase protein